MKPNIGSVSSGTMRAEDLIPTFLDELESQKPLRREHRRMCKRIRARMDSRNDGGGETDTENMDDTYDLEDLFDALEEYAPTYFYFGAHPGNGSDYGYWLPEGFPDDQFDGLKVSDLSEVPKGYVGEVLHVNDHGNMSLYVYHRNHRRTELWGIV